MVDTLGHLQAEVDNGMLDSSVTSSLFPETLTYLSLEPRGGGGRGGVSVRGGEGASQTRGNWGSESSGKLVTRRFRSLDFQAKEMKRGQWKSDCRWYRPC